MDITSTVKEKLAPLQAHYLEVSNESAQHNVPAGAQSHFKVVVVSDLFTDQNLVERHRRVYQLLATELQTHIHALALHTYTPDEWQTQSPSSPHCRGGSAQSP